MRGRRGDCREEVNRLLEQNRFDSRRGEKENESRASGEKNTNGVVEIKIREVSILATQLRRPGRERSGCWVERDRGETYWIRKVGRYFSGTNTEQRFEEAKDVSSSSSKFLLPWITVSLVKGQGRCSPVPF